MIGYEPINDRVLTVKIAAKPRKVTLIQIYAPTTAAEEEKVEKLNRILAKELSRIPKREICIVMGDFNAKVGRPEDVAYLIGRYGIG